MHSFFFHSNLSNVFLFCCTSSDAVLFISNKTDFSDLLVLPLWPSSPLIAAFINGSDVFFYLIVFWSVTLGLCFDFFCFFFHYLCSLTKFSSLFFTLFYDQLFSLYFRNQSWSPLENSFSSQHVRNFINIIHLEKIKTNYK